MTIEFIKKLSESPLGEKSSDIFDNENLKLLDKIFAEHLNNDFGTQPEKWSMVSEILFNKFASSARLQQLRLNKVSHLLNNNYGLDVKLQETDKYVVFILNQQIQGKLQNYLESTQLVQSDINKLIEMFYQDFQSVLADDNTGSFAHTKMYEKIILTAIILGFISTLSYSQIGLPTARQKPNVNATSPTKIVSGRRRAVTMSWSIISSAAGMIASMANARSSFTMRRRSTNMSAR
jgi:hypothetical protein